MNAVISGRAGVALIQSGDDLYSIHYDDLDRRVHRAAHEFSLLLGGVNDLNYCSSCDESAVIERLEDAVDQTEALDLVLYLLDRTLSDQARRTAARELDELLAYPEIADYLNSILFARPLSESADLAGATALCDEAVARAAAFLRSLAKHQPAIRRVRAAWESVVDELFADKADAARDAESACLRAGMFFEFATAGSDAKRLNAAVYTTLSHRELTQAIPAATLRPLPMKLASQIRTLCEREGHRLPTITSQPSRVEADWDEREEREPTKKRRRSFDRTAAFKNTESQKNLAIDLWKHGRIQDAKPIVDQLVDYNLKNGGAEYACKTLCSLAKSAQELGQFATQLELTERAIALEQDDSWSWSQHGKALLDMDRPHEALISYDRALELGSNVEVQNGRAEVLKALGRLDDALEAYDEVRRAHPRDVFAQNGRAEVLKVMGRLDDALEAYDEVRRAHPENVVAQTGRAEVLKVMGRLDDALEAYDEVRRAHPENVVAQTGRAEVLKVMGRLDDALEAYDEVRRAHPRDVFAQNGRAEVLKVMGRLDDALEAYDEVRRAHPRDVFAQNGRAEVLKVMGRLDDALEAYDEVRRAHPENVVAQNGRAEVLKVTGRLDDALEAYDDVRRAHPRDVFAQNGRAEVLKVMGRLDDALEAYDEVRRAHPEYVVAQTGRAEVLKVMGRLDDALEAYDEVRRAHPRDVFAQTGRAEVLKAQGRLDDALQAYDDVRARWPSNLIARNGRCGVLVLLGQDDVAISDLPATEPKHLQDWVGWHIRGMILLRKERLDEAREVFELGVNRCPFTDSVDYFVTGLSLVDLTQRRFAAAVERLAQVRKPEIANFAALLRTHALGADEQFEAAKDAFQAAMSPTSSLAAEIREEVASRYISRHGARHDDAWLLHREIRLLLAL